MKSWVQQLAEELVRLEENPSTEASATKAAAQMDMPSHIAPSSSDSNDVIRAINNHNRAVDDFHKEKDEEQKQEILQTIQDWKDEVEHQRKTKEGYWE